MAAGTYNFEVHQGETFDPELTWSAGDAGPVDLTGYGARMQLRKEPGDAEVAVELTEANGGIVLGAIGTIRLLLTPAQTTALVRGTYYYDLIMTEPGGAQRTLLEGSFKLQRAITHD